MTQDQVNCGYVPQNWVPSPSPPDAVGTKSLFGWQLARRGQLAHQLHGAVEWVESDAPPQLQSIVVDGLQYAALAK